MMRSSYVQLIPVSKKNLQLHQFVPIFECQQEGITLEWNHDRSPTHFLIEHFDHLEVKILHTVTKSCL